MQVQYDADARWLTVQRGRVVVAANLAGERQTLPVAGSPQQVLLHSTTGFVFGAGHVEIDGESVVVLELADPVQAA